MQLIPLTFEAKALTGFSHKLIIGIADLTAANTTQTLIAFPGAPTYLANQTLVTQTAGQLPAGLSVKGAAAYATTLFTGPGLTAMVLDVGDGGSVGRYVANANTDLWTVGTGNSKNPVLGTAKYAYTPADVLAANAQIAVKFTATGCNLNSLTAGQVEVYLDITDLNDIVPTIEPGTP